MAEHNIKIKKMYYDAVLSGEKTFEIRKNDRNYKVGDIIRFIPIADDCDMIIPHSPNEYKITYVFHGGEYGLEKGYCVFGITPTIEKNMNDLISRSALLAALEKEQDECEEVMTSPNFFTARKIIREHPTIEAVPVVHGEWKYKHWCCFECSECKHTVDRCKHEDLTPYCPNCGAKMKGSTE